MNNTIQIEWQSQQDNIKDLNCCQSHQNITHKWTRSSDQAQGYVKGAVFNYTVMKNNSDLWIVPEVTWLSFHLFWYAELWMCTIAVEKHEKICRQYNGKLS